MSIAPKPKSPSATPLIACTPMHLPHDLLIPSAKVARAENPRNHPLAINAMKTLDPDFQITSEHIAVLTTKFWRIKGLKLTVSFLDTPPAALQAKILSHMNAWGDTADVAFVPTAKDGQVRIARTIGDGHWSYLGTDILLADKAKPTMNLDGFTLDTPDSEYFRVVRHETGHTLGCPHEHMRADLIADIDREKAITYYMASQGWTRDQVIQQVLTPISEGSLWGTGKSDNQSIMCYQIPASLTIDGVTIPGGTDIDASDRAFIAQVYPKGPGVATAPPAAASDTVGASPSAAPVAEAAPVAASTVVASSTAATRHHDCVEVDMAGGVRINVHPGASTDQIRRVVAALRE